MSSIITFFLDTICHILPLCLLLIAAAFLLISRKKYRSGLNLGIVGVLFLYTFSLFPVAGLILRPLQFQYNQYQAGHSPAAQYVVVLGGWHKTRPHIPPSNQLSQDSLIRTVEAISIYHQNPGSKLLFSGGKPENDPKSNAKIMAEIAAHLGVPNSDMILEERPQDTKDEAKYIKETIQTDPFILVTSASHMPRAIMLFQKQNLTPIPAPVNYSLLEEIPFSLMPSAIALQSSEKALHEYLGILWAWLKRQI
jgi:uncharacterized SAM-binding protein YcdF (DUF218 family)